MPNQENSVAVVMVPFPAQGHLNQLLHLSRIILSYGIQVHYVGISTHNRQAKVQVHGWDPPCFDACWHLRKPVSELLRMLSEQARKVIVIHDSMMGSIVQEVGSIPNADSYVFHTVSAFTLFFYAWESMGKPEVNAEMPDDEGDIPSLEGCFTNDFLEFIAMQYRYLSFNAGNIYNTSKVIEGAYLELLGETMRGKQHWALGPFNPVRIAEKNSSATRHYCLE
ncbi:hypothetical protein CRYUN_Cryun16bG0074400 [Craigia yunnanensis]